MMSINIKGKCNSCCVPGCNSNSTPSFRNRGGRITTFKLPRDETRRKEWIQAIPKRKYPPTVNHNVCILHFNEEDFSRNNRRIDLKKSAVPSIFPFVDGQRIDDNADVSDEVWTEYVGHRNDSIKRKFEMVDNELPAPAADISRILIERLRIPGSKYFGIDTAEITIQPDSENESDAYEPKATVKAKSPRTSSTRTPRKRIRKTIKSDDEEEGTASVEYNDDFDEIPMNDSPLYPATMDEDLDCKEVHVNQFSVKPVNVTVADNDDKFGDMVSSKLVLMSPVQRLISQKIISEILLKGQLGMLKSSLNPVLVSGGYMKNVSNGMTDTGNVATIAATADCLSSMSGDNSDDASDDDNNDCDPLMCQVKQETIRESKGESFHFVKNEICWSDDD